ncbi:hypothetical protein DSO57_1038479 [Entomophthora muscae]|uniref:Uncharacterized protein n=1 Tax=Entomophthora muscae TaxID=34485 RepID=A0ACC2T9P4_9FUNG|nr:hypothetical protein DSO57_1038479 [Entomophthora muscae]
MEEKATRGSTSIPNQQYEKNTHLSPKQTPSVTAQTSTITKPLPATKQIHTITTQKPATTKPFPAANMQMHVATAQASTKFASPTCKPPKTSHL